MKTLAITMVLAMAGTAYADQCAWIDAKAATKAKKIVESHPKVIAFCEPCGEKAPGIPEAATSVEIGTPDGGFKELQINGTGVDLAYTYVQMSPGLYRNLAMLAGCEVTDVSPSLKIADETPNGVLITADPAPPPPVVEPQLAPPPPIVLTLPTAAPPPPPQIVVLETRPAFPWAMIALAGMTGFGATLFAVLAIATLRRRRAMRPRATELRADHSDK
ncbi:MAG TPA: hypothetical protein VMZ53_24495 [Kofleriaceae bacterium]|nr:hypothetical protein [Kofleriaceae bacterium]